MARIESEEAQETEKTGEGQAAEAVDSPASALLEDTQQSGSGSSSCIYRGDLPKDYHTKDLPRGTVDDNGNCTFNWHGQTYVEGQGVKPKPHKGDEHPGMEKGSASMEKGSAGSGKTSDIDSKHSTGNEKEWTEEEMANAKPMPLPVLELGNKVAAGDRRPGQEGMPIRTIWHLNDDQKKLIDNYLKEAGLNAYGDPKDTSYEGGTPLFNETTGHMTDRYDYILNGGLNIPGLDRNKLARASY